MPTDIAIPYSTLVASFPDADAACIAGSLLGDAGIQCDEGTPVGESWGHSVTVADLSPATLERARVILKHAGASEIREGRNASPRPKFGLPIEVGGDLA